MERVLYEVPVATLNERARLREHRLRLDISRHRLAIEAKDVLIGGGKDARTPESCDYLFPDYARLIAEIFRRRERAALRDRLGVVDHARARLSCEDL